MFSPANIHKGTCKYSGLNRALGRPVCRTTQTPRRVRQTPRVPHDRPELISSFGRACDLDDASADRGVPLIR